MKIQVPPNTPVVTFDKADKADIMAGGHVLVVAAKDGDKLTALRVLVGKGIKPPCKVAGPSGAAAQPAAAPCCFYPRISC